MRYSGDFEITFREVLASISIIAFMAIIGFMISSKISENQMDKNEKYYKALKIKETDIFQYAMDTNVGNAFVYGDLEAVDTVSFPDVKGEYLYIRKVKEVYTMHTRIVTTTINGKVHTRTEVYYTWDNKGSESKTSNRVIFNGIEFDSSKFNLTGTEYIDTVYKSKTVRYVYRAFPKKSTGTIFTELKDGTISKANFYKYKIEETIEKLESGSGVVLFWVFWIILTIVLVGAFYYIDNDWLE